MSPKTPLPVTAAVVDWAIGASGESLVEIARAVGVDESVVMGWRAGHGAPSVGQLRKLANKLHRPFAAFFLPKPPSEPPLTLEFRHPPNVQARSLSPNELRHVRRALRLQEVIAWLVTELGDSKPRLPVVDVGAPPKEIALKARGALGIAADEPRKWPTSSAAFDGWRAIVERNGILVFLFPLGKDACRGFSLAHAVAPLVAVNSGWNEEARIFTLWHEVGHILTDTGSACVEGIGEAVTRSGVDDVERWCERFASHVLMPDEAVLAALHSAQIFSVTQVSQVQWLANRFKVSLRAAVIKLIDLGRARWDLYRELSPASDKKRPGGGGGGGRDLGEIREDQLGRRTAELFDRAVRSDVMSRTQALDYLDIGDSNFEALASAGNE
jgi:Zn-dependent peptidase ImmA (M78 family)/transcriptional regulator with XRE-family HTH domain